jgi:large subunit ribosomal protein L15
MKFKRKKVTKYRGSKTHGCGSMKKRRGAGNRGGRGRAGSGKRGDGKKPSYWREEKKKGFTSKNRLKINAINLSQIQNNLAVWTEKKLVNKTAKGYEIELKKLGYNKVLGTGLVTEKLLIKTDFASAKANEKVKTAGGEITPPQKTKPAEDKE